MKSGLRIALVVTSIFFLSCWSLPAHAAGCTVKTGYLTCHEASGWGFVFGSSRELRCSYATSGGRTEYYGGSISKFGADIGYLQSAVILWAVAATTKDLIDACRRAMTHYRDGGKAWAALQDRGMAIDWSWEAGPAEQYAASYWRAVALRREHRSQP